MPLTRRLAYHKRKPAGLLRWFLKFNPLLILTIDLIEETTIESMVKREQYWIDIYNPQYNTAGTAKYKALSNVIS